MRQIVRKINRDNFIAVVFLVIVFIIPIVTLCGGASSDEAVMTEAEAVLSNNGTTAGNVDADSSDAMQGDNAQVDEGQAMVEESDSTEPVKSVFTRIQNALNDFTEKLFLRPIFIEGNTKLTSILTGGTYMESTQVLLGKEKWLFYKTQNDGYPIYDYMGINHFSEAEMAAMASNLILARDYFEKEKGIRFVAVTIPNKEIVYAEYMPDTIARVNSVSRGEQFAAYMQNNTDVAYVYPKEAFLEYKGQYPLFYKTDTHWNHIGAFVGVQEIFNTLYGSKMTPESVFFTKGQKDFAGDLSVIAGVADEYAIDTVYEFEPESVDSSQKRMETAIVVGDSFGGFLSVIARGYYEEVYWIDTDEFSISMVDEYGADVVIWETVERLQETYMQESLLD